jgi:hypothetical protein
VESVVESFDSTGTPRLPRVAVYRWKSVESTKINCREARRFKQVLDLFLYNKVIQVALSTVIIPVCREDGEDEHVQEDEELHMLCCSSQDVASFFKLFF